MIQEEEFPPAVCGYFSDKIGDFPPSFYAERFPLRIRIMRWYKALSLKSKFLLVAALFVVVVCAGLYFQIERIFLSYLQSELEQQAHVVASNLKLKLNFYDQLQVQHSTDNLIREQNEISRIVVYQRDGDIMKPFVKSDAVNLPPLKDLYVAAIESGVSYRSEFNYKEKEYWEFAYPIVEGPSVVGLITITLNFTQYKAFMSAIRRATFLILVGGLLFTVIILNVYFEVAIRRRLAKIVAAMEKVKKSDFNARAPADSGDEIGLLASDFNTMTQALGDAQTEVIRQNRMLEQRVREATSELRSRNLELFEAQDELRRTSRLATAGQVAAMLAHDLGSPLSSISGHLQLMLEDADQAPEDRERLQLLLNQVERLSDTIRNFLNNITGLHPQFEPCDLNALLDHLIQLTWPVLTERNIEPILSLDRRLPLIRADVNQLQQLFLNLFTNAIDAMREGGSLQIITHFAEDLQRAEIRVEDSGSGISAENVKNLFRPFFSTKEFGRGSGLGLTICQEIVKAHKGQISVTSREGVGTSFDIWLPAQTIEKKDHEKAELASG